MELSMRSAAVYPSIPVERGVYIYKRPGRSSWSISITRRGSRVRYSLETQDQASALAIARRRADELLSFKHGMPLAREASIDDLLHHFRRHQELRARPKTQRTNLDNLARVGDFVRATLGITRPLRSSDFSPEIIERYMKHRLDSGLAVATVNRDWQTLRSFFGLATLRRLVPQNPLDLVRQLPMSKRSIPATLSGEEVTRLLVEAARPIGHRGPGLKPGSIGPRLIPLHDLVLFAANTGARLGEIRFLEWKDIELESRQIQLRSREEYMVKDRRDRAVRANGLVLAMLHRRLAERRPEIPWVFPSTVGRPLDPGRVLKQLQAVARRAGLPKTNFNILRHTALTAIAKSGVPNFVLKEMAGHATVRTTERYYIGHLGGRDWEIPEVGKPKLPELSLGTDTFVRNTLEAISLPSAMI